MNLSSSFFNPVKVLIFTALFGKEFHTLIGLLQCDSYSISAAWARNSIFPSLCGFVQLEYIPPPSAHWITVNNTDRHTHMYTEPVTIANNWHVKP